MPDIVIADYGTVATFTPITPAAREWVDGNVQVEPWQYMGASIVCEPRLLQDLIGPMQEAGLTIKSE